MKKKIVTVPFDRERVPPRQNALVMPLLWLWCFLVTRAGKLQIHKVRMRGLKPPFLVLGTHHSFMDFYVTPLALYPHRANYVSELEGFEAYGEWMYRQAGCLGTRKFITDLSLIRNIKRIMDRNGILVLYPEARYANVGTSSRLPRSLGKLCKYLKVPVVTINMKGNYLQSPIWNLRKRGGVRLDATITQLFTAQEVQETAEEEIQKAVSEALTYDEYTWQEKTGQRITEPWRAEGLEKPLYQCHQCKTEFAMRTKGSILFCKSCNAGWKMDELGRLISLTPLEKDKILRIPQWYEWERSQVESEAGSGNYSLKTKVHIESLPNAVNFIDLGEGVLEHNEKGFLLTFRDYGQSREQVMFFPSASLFSIHTEYDYRGKGQCITLSTPDNTYFIFPLEEGFNATKIQFATEFFYVTQIKGRKSCGQKHNK